MSDTTIVEVPAWQVRPGDYLMSGRAVTAVVVCGRQGRCVDVQWTEPVIFPAGVWRGEWEPRVEADFGHTFGTLHKSEAPVSVIRVVGT